MLEYIVSDEIYLIDKYISKILNENNLSKDSLNFQTLKNKEEIKSFLESYSFFGEKKVGIVPEVDDNDIVSLLSADIDDILIFYGKLDKRKKTYKFFKKEGLIKTLPTPNYLNFVIECFNKKNIKITKPLAKRILELTGENDLYNIESEVKKIILLNQKITVELIEKTVLKSLLMTSFDLSNMLLSQNVVKSLEILEELFEQSVDMIALLGLLHQNFAIIKSLKNTSSKELVEVGFNSYFIKNLDRYSKSNEYTDKRISHMLKEIEIADIELKSSVNKEKHIMTKLILNLLEDQI